MWRCGMNNSFYLRSGQSGVENVWKGAGRWEDILWFMTFPANALTGWSPRSTSIWKHLSPETLKEEDDWTEWHVWININHSFCNVQQQSSNNLNFRVWQKRSWPNKTERRWQILVTFKKHKQLLAEQMPTSIGRLGARRDKEQTRAKLTRN